MSKHVFGAIITPLGTAANNRGLTEGNITTLQKLVWDGAVHTTVSAEAIRFALRRRLADVEECNRHFKTDDDRVHAWRDPTFSRWAAKSKEAPFIDDDLLGFMSANAAKAEGKAADVQVRRAVLEVTRAVSMTAWPGDVTFNAASPGATPSAQKKGSNPVPYGTEMHATRYQYGFAMTPGRLRVPARAAAALRCLCALGEVAGNHGRFLFDFSPESVIFRIAEDPAPRILYAFDINESGQVASSKLKRLLASGDVGSGEIIVGGEIAAQFRDEKDVKTFEGVRAACEAATARVN